MMGFIFLAIHDKLSKLETKRPSLPPAGGWQAGPLFAMKKKIHPKWYKNAKIICACGNIRTAGSTESELHVEICSNCHPFFTGQEKLVDTEGRVEKFEKKTAIAKAQKEQKRKKKEAKKVGKKKTVRPKSLKDMLRLAKEGK